MRDTCERRHHLVGQTDGTSPGPWPRGCGRPSARPAQVTDIQNQRKVVGSNLTALEPSGLTRVELGFALALAVAASGLALLALAAVASAGRATFRALRRPAIEELREL